MKSNPYLRLYNLNRYTESFNTVDNFIKDEQALYMSTIVFSIMRGRPVKSEIRQNIVDILNNLKKGYGYEIYKIYIAIFPKCTREVIYYHLKKGLDTGEFIIKQTKQEKGNFSWGPIVEKTFYSLGPKAAPRVNKRVKDHLKKK